jgi:hypothetical protein
MPYIHKDERKMFQPMLREFVGKFELTPGQLNYLITTIIEDQVFGNESYTKFNEIIGVLECVKQEFYRRVVIPYEEKKKEQNGDVYP